MKNFFKSLFGGKQEQQEPEVDPNIIGTSSVFPDPELKEEAAPAAAPTGDIVLSIPGPWANWNAFAEAMSQRHGAAFLTAGRMIFSRDSDYRMAIVFSSHNPELEASFRAAAAGRLNDAQLASVAEHKSVVYLTAGGSALEKVFAASACATAVLQAGGTAVKVESAGAAFSPEDWQSLTSDDIAFVAAFLGLERNEPGSIRSYGLRAFALRDVLCHGDYPDNVLDFIADNYIKHLLFENPEINDGETFTAVPDAPVFTISVTADIKNPAGHAFHNPYGLIVLEPA